MRGGPHSSARVTPQQLLRGREGVWEGARTCPGLCQEPCKCVPARSLPASVRVQGEPHGCAHACACCVHPAWLSHLELGGALGAQGSQAELWDPGPGGSQICLWGYPRAPGLGWWVSMGRTRCQQGGLLQKCGFLPPQNDFGFLTKWKFSPKSPHWEKLRVSSRKGKLVDVLPVAKRCVLLAVPPPQ